MIGQRRIVPDRVWDMLMRTQFPTPRRLALEALRASSAASPSASSPASRTRRRRFPQSSRPIGPAGHGEAAQLVGGRAGDVPRCVADHDRRSPRVGVAEAAGPPAGDGRQRDAVIGIRAERTLAGAEVRAQAGAGQLQSGHRLVVAGEQGAGSRPRDRLSELSSSATPGRTNWRGPQGTAGRRLGSSARARRQRGRRFAPPRRPHRAGSPGRSPGRSARRARSARSARSVGRMPCTSASASCIASRWAAVAPESKRSVDVEEEQQHGRRASALERHARLEQLREGRDQPRCGIHVGQHRAARPASACSAAEPRPDRWGYRPG